VDAWYGRLQISFPNDPTIFVEFDVHETVVNTYGLPYFKLALSHKALTRVDTVGFRCRSDGYLYELATVGGGALNVIVDG
jgi:hypothetical protein